MQNTLIVGLVLLIIGIGIGYTFSATSVPSLTPEEQRVEGHMMPGGSKMGQNIDQHFIVQMIPHHEGAVEMAKVALERSKRPEIISLANGIIEAQTREINDMSGWYGEWFGSTLPEGGMGGMHMGGMTGDLDDLKAASNSEFDREFISQMIPHHEMAVMMAEMLRAGTARSEMEVLADNIITSQSSEIEMMRGWLKNWY